ncbi:metalloregulator ArsR/SmtB family transcription factor [Micromonospora sp. NPDC023888]|uniref:ArsR/SmtB family transcription factor n=1 Tax=Micromonospora sp. NPDC023888 TaxID=3155607 RepID=UPI0033DFEC4D
MHEAAGIAPPGFVTAVGHPVRWRLISELAHSDLAVHELTALLGQPQSLVSYHLGKLRTAELVTARRSSATAATPTTRSPWPTAATCCPAPARPCTPGSGSLRPRRPPR